MFTHTGSDYSDYTLLVWSKQLDYRYTTLLFQVALKKEISNLNESYVWM